MGFQKDVIQQGLGDWLRKKEIKRKKVATWIEHINRGNVLFWFRREIHGEREGDKERERERIVVMTNVLGIPTKGQRDQKRTDRKRERERGRIESVECNLTQGAFSHSLGIAIFFLLDFL